MRLANDAADSGANASEIYTTRINSYLRFIRVVGYPQGLRAHFMQSPDLHPGLRVLDAGCGTGVTTLALRSALEARGMSAGRMDAFDLTPAMLEQFRTTLDSSEIKGIDLDRADVLRLETLPEDWKDYDLLITASMLEYVSRSDFPKALRAIRARLRRGGKLQLFITRNNVLMRPLIERWWAANLYTRSELRVALEDAGFIDPTFGHFRFPYRHLDLWGHVVSARV